MSSRGFGSTLLNESVVQAHQFRDRLHALLGHVDLTGLTMQRGVHPLATCWRYSSGTPSIWVITSTGKNAEKSFTTSNRSASDLGDVAVDGLGHHRPHRLDGPRGEHLVDQAAHLPVLGRIHEDDHLRHHRFVGPDRRQVQTVRRRIRLEVLVGRRDILVPRQRIEVVLLVVVHRRLLAHAPVNLPRPVEELLGERIEDELGRSQWISLSAPTRACADVTLRGSRSPVGDTGGPLPESAVRSPGSLHPAERGGSPCRRGRTPRG